MEGRSTLHDKISDLLATLEINNNRLSLHEERISQLDIDVMRNQCIELYEEINRLALSGALEQEPSVPTPPVQEETVKVQEVHEEPAPKPVEEAEPDEDPVQELPRAERPAPQQQVKPVQKEQDAPRSIHMKLQDEAEMVSLFEKYNSKPIDNISKAINISKRFEFQNNFFDGDAASYKSFIAQLDGAGEREAAFQIYHQYKEELGWTNEELKDELKSLLYRKYAT